MAFTMANFDMSKMTGKYIKISDGTETIMNGTSTTSFYTIGGQDYDVILTALDGWEFTRIFRVSTGANGTISPDKKTATIRINVSSGNTFGYQVNTQVATVTPPPKTKYSLTMIGTNQTTTVKNNETNVITTLTSSTSLDEGTYTVTSTASNGYRFTSVGFYDEYGTGTDLSLNTDKTVATGTITLNKALEGTASTELIPPPTKTYLVALRNVSQAYLECINKTTGVTTIINADSQKQLESGDYTFNIKSNKGYILIKSGRYNQYGQEKEITRNSDNTVATIDLKLLTGIDFYANTDTAPVIEVPPPTSDSLLRINNVYMMDIDKIKSLSNERFNFTTGDPEHPIEHDLGDYMINLIEIPFKLNPEQIGNLQKIILGKYTVETKGTQIVSDELQFNIGKIEIPQKYNNSFDYLNTFVKLNLPFIDPLEIDVEYAIGQTLEIFYIIDVYTGDTTVNITSTKTGKVIYSNRFKIGRTIPFISLANRQVTDTGEKQGLNNGITKAYIEVIRNIPINTNFKYNNSVMSGGLLKDVSGYITIEDIELKTFATSKEQDTIHTLLRNGVNIK